VTNEVHGNAIERASGHVGQGPQLKVVTQKPGGACLVSTRVSVDTTSLLHVQLQLPAGQGLNENWARNKF